MRCCSVKEFAVVARRPRGTQRKCNNASESLFLIDVRLIGGWREDLGVAGRSIGGDWCAERWLDSGSDVRDLD